MVPRAHRDCGTQQGIIYAMRPAYATILAVLVACIGCSPPAPTQAPWARDPWVKLLLLAAAVTGAASFLYEIAWIRMMSLVLGGSTHSFELMLAARGDVPTAPFTADRKDSDKPCTN